MTVWYISCYSDDSLVYISCYSDDSLGYEYPFCLKTVMKDGVTCDKCPWYRFCRGCRIHCNTDTFELGHGGAFVAIDWEPTALHLRYQTSLERVSIYCFKVNDCCLDLI